MISEFEITDTALLSEQVDRLNAENAMLHNSIREARRYNAWETGISVGMVIGGLGLLVLLERACTADHNIDTCYLTVDSEWCPQNRNVLDASPKQLMLSGHRSWAIDTHIACVKTPEEAEPIAARFKCKITGIR